MYIYKVALFKEMGPSKKQKLTMNMLQHLLSPSPKQKVEAVSLLVQRKLHNEVPGFRLVQSFLPHPQVCLFKSHQP